MKYFICTEQQMEAYVRWKTEYYLKKAFLDNLKFDKWLQSNPCPIQAKEIPSEKEMIEEAVESCGGLIAEERYEHIEGFKSCFKWMRDLLIK